jgi:hypothetical protein
LHYFALSVTTSLKIPGAVIPRRVFTRPGSIATGRASCRSSNVRNAPLATVGPKKAACREGPLAEVTGSFFDDVVGDGEQFIRNGEAERLGSLEIDNEIEFGRLLDR